MSLDLKPIHLNLLHNDDILACEKITNLEDVMIDKSKFD